jgi:hypothetical protein
MRVLVACESSGRVREAFRARGHEAWSCDLLPAEDGSPYHLRGDVRLVLSEDYYKTGEHATTVFPASCWDMLIGFPDCTYVCGSGLHWNKRRPGRADETAKAVEFFRWMSGLPIPRIALENPVGLLSTEIRKPELMFQPYHFGEDASKKTCLWLKNLPPLQPTKFVAPRLVVYEGAIRERWSNQTDSGQNKLGPSDDRWKDRARTYQGVADAMAEQWGLHTPSQSAVGE